MTETDQQKATHDRIISIYDALQKVVDIIEQPGNAHADEQTKLCEDFLNQVAESVEQISVNYIECLKAGKIPQKNLAKNIENAARRIFSQMTLVLQSAQQLVEKRSS